ncbi:FAD-dependent monooxygenase [Pseudonocardia sp. NPDC046786]|uniref:FAD-dependent monooxygenase n=1 Tax=Pseudonocardia sp. NPDC046786 TaxID=3155471 RepID=UPI0033C5869B
MRVAVVGAGPGGLFLAALLADADPSVSVTVFERNRAEDAFGFGVVFADRALAGIHRADPATGAALDSCRTHWDEIEVRLGGERLRCGGNGMSAVVRHTLLRVLQDRARAAGAELRFGTEVGLADLVGADLVVGADGAGSRIRAELEARPGSDLGSTVHIATARYIWLGADHPFDGLTFVHERNSDGAFAAHAYPVGQGLSTFIVETDEDSWRRGGLDGFDPATPPGSSDLDSRRYLERLFAGHIGGRALLANNSRWARFRTRRTRRWYSLAPRPVALLGDAVHTAHFSVGSGTTMAMQDAVALAAALREHPDDLGRALARYEAEARPTVQRIQNAAGPSLAWWERFGCYQEVFEPWQFTYHFLTRSIDDATLARRAPEFVDATHLAWRDRHGAEPLLTPLVTPVLSTARRTVPVVVEGAQPSGVDVLDPAGRPLRLALRSPGDPAVAQVYGLRVAAPADETGVDAAVIALERAVADAGPARPALVVVFGGGPAARALLAEHARTRCAVPALSVEPDGATARATTLVLSGRTDLVGTPRNPGSITDDCHTSDIGVR